MGRSEKVIAEYESLFTRICPSPYICDLSQRVGVGGLSLGEIPPTLTYPLAFFIFSKEV
jgi:hypothetical protein